MKKYEAALAIQVLPKVEGDQEIIRVVDEVIAYLKANNESVFVGPFETTIEGDFDTLWRLAGECQKICIRSGAPAVTSYIKLSYNPHGGVLTTAEKVTKHHA